MPSRMYDKRTGDGSNDGNDGGVVDRDQAGPAYQQIMGNTMIHRKVRN